MSPRVDLCVEKFFKKLVGRKDVEDALQRLDELTQEEARMAAAETLEITRGIDDNVQVIDDNVKVIDGNVKVIDDNVKVIGGNVRGIDDNVKGMGEQLQNVDKKVEGVDHKIGSVVKGEL